MNRRPAQLRTTLLLLLDVLATAAALWMAYLLRFRSGIMDVSEKYLPDRYLAALPPSVLACIAAYALAGRYGTRASDHAGEVRTGFGGVLAASLLLAAATLFYRDEYQFSRGLLLLFIPVGTLALLVSSGGTGLWLRTMQRRGYGVRRCLFLGHGPGFRELNRLVKERSRDGLVPVGTVEDPEELPARIRETKADLVFLALPAARHEVQVRALGILAGEMVDVLLLPDLGPGTIVNPELTMVSGLPVLTLRQGRFYGVHRLLKRGFDLVLGTFFLLLFLPVMLLTGLAVLLLSGRPIFYAQVRMGLDGREFRILKFRTMRVNAEDETGAIWARPEDERCTKVGLFLRRFSLDEFPQLLNVLRGDMSLVGPRPERPVLIESFRKSFPGYMLRHRIPAGLTGWAQIHGLRGESDLASRLRHDLVYLERWSLWFDLEILVRTVWHVIRGKNAG